MHFNCITNMKFKLVILFFSLLVSCKNKEVETAYTAKAEEKRSVALLYNEELPIEELEDLRISKDVFYSGKKALYYTPQMEYSAGFKLYLSKVSRIETCDSLEVNLKYFTKQKLNGLKVVWTIDDENGKNLSWSGSIIENSKVSTWADFRLGFKLDKKLANKNNVLNIYVWNPSKDEVWIDDFNFNLFDIYYEKQNDSNVNCNFYYDFESNKDIIKTECIKESEAHSGKMTCNLSDGEEYGITVKKPLYLFGNEVIKKLAASIWIYPKQKEHDLILTFSCKDKATGDFKFWQGKSTIDGAFELNKWTKLNSAVNLPFEKFNLDDEIEICIWNRGKTAILVDDLHIVFGEQPERKSEPNLIGNNASTTSLAAQQTLLYDTINTQFLSNFHPNDFILTAPFYHPQKGLESIVHIKNNRVQMHCYEAQKNSFNLVWETSNLNHPFLVKNNIFFAGDFDNDKTSEILIVNKQTLFWELYHFKNLSWELKTKGTNLFPSQWCNSKHINVSNALYSNNKTVLFKCNSYGIETLSLIDGNWTIGEPKIVPQGFEQKDTDFLLDWNNSSFLKLNTDWRFDVKLLTLVDHKLTIDKNVELTKNKKGLNPKYYEHTKLWTGHFISTKSKHLLVSYLNCANADYNGLNCTTIENNDMFPNGISFYH